MPADDLTSDSRRFTVEDFRERARSHVQPPPEENFGDHYLNPDFARHARANAQRDAAVLIAVTDTSPEPSVILTKRTTNLRTHSGQIAFPGGRIDPEDESPEAAAIRECDEETGIGGDHIEVVGRLPDYYSGSGFRIYPVLAVVSDGYRIVPNPAEVEEVFEVPLHFLMDEANHGLGSKEFQGKQRHYYEMPYYDWHIWGVTAGIIRMMYERLYA